MGTLAGGCKGAAPPVQAKPAADEAEPVAASEAAPAPATETPTNEPADEPKPAIPLPTHVAIYAQDRTTPAERPVDLSTGIQALAEAAAQRAGFTVTDKGNESGVLVHYALVQNGKPDPKTEKGRIAWGVEVAIRLVDEDGLGEELSGRRGDERPFVRGAIPDLKAGFESVLSDALEGAFRDVAMQIAFRDAPVERCEKALTAQHPEERWAAMRRLGELGAKDSAAKILEAIDGADELTVAIGVGVLGRLRNPIAVKPLAKLAEGPNPQNAMLVATAIAAIGGPDARKYLRLIGASHPSPVVQQLVSDLLADYDDTR